MDGMTSDPTPSEVRTIRLGRGEAYLPRAQWDALGKAYVDALNGGDTHVFVIEPDGSVTDTEAT